MFMLQISLVGRVKSYVSRFGVGVTYTYLDTIGQPGTQTFLPCGREYDTCVIPKYCYPASGPVTVVYGQAYDDKQRSIKKQYATDQGDEIRLQCQTDEFGHDPAVHHVKGCWIACANSRPQSKIQHQCPPLHTKVNPMDLTFATVPVCTPRSVPLCNPR